MDMLIGKKIGMTQIFAEDGRVIPVSVIEAGPCSVVQEKTVDKDGYAAFQIGFLDKKLKKTTKPQSGHFQKAGVEPQRVLKEVKPDHPEKYEVGKTVKVADLFQKGDLVNVSGISKGKGFAGVVKKYGFAGGPSTHGSRFHRTTGAIGACATPSRTFKNMKMPGQMGNRKVTVKNLEIVDVLDERNVLLVKGAVPGSKRGVLTITKIKKAK
jgi:large subunit ribosomal protein L3